MLQPAGALAATHAGEVPVLRLPVTGVVVVGFDAPEPYGPGHRGLDLAAPVGTAVGSPVTGRVQFAGSVAGRRWVTVAATPRVLVTVGPLAEVAVRAGDVVVAGVRLGSALGTHDGRATLHLSVRVDGRYVDPAPRLGRVPVRATLLPSGAATPLVAHARGRPVGPAPGPTRGHAGSVPWARVR